MPCSLVDVSEDLAATLKKGKSDSSESIVPVYHTTRHISSFMLIAVRTYNLTKGYLQQSQR
jgi:hypothetical protein